MVAQSNPRARRRRRRAKRGNIIETQQASRGQEVLPGRRAFLLTAAGCLGLYAALPPLNWSLLAWLAPVPWLWLAADRRLAPRPAYLAVWAASAVFWMATLQWVRYPHVANYAGVFALGCYLGCYLVVFLAVVRTAVHWMGIPLVLAAPTAWVALELVRAHLLTGFLMASIAHTQVRVVPLIQIADLGGEYAVMWLIVFVAACISQVKRQAPGRSLAWIACMAAAVGASFLYGRWREGAATEIAGPRVALIQGTITPELKSDLRRRQMVTNQYLELSRRAARENDNLDLIMWPETMFRYPLITYSDDVAPPVDQDWEPADLHATAQDHRELIRQTARMLGTDLLLGIDVFHYGPGTINQYNAALHVDADGELLGRAEKHHLAAFGEYIPFADSLPWLYGVTPLAGGITPGKYDETMRVADTSWAVSICYECILPHLIRGQVARHIREGREPDVLANLTNVGWFRESTALDLHLACGVFRAIENRKPLLIAANTGLSAQIDAWGRIIRLSQRGQEQVIVARVGTTDLASAYVRYGDWFAGLCLLATIVVIGWWGAQILRARRVERRKSLS